MLLHIISRCILPGCWRGAVLGGMGVGVVLVDADFQFSMLRLFQILERRVADVMERMKNKDQNSKAATKSESTFTAFQEEEIFVHSIFSSSGIFLK